MAKAIIGVIVGLVILISVFLMIDPNVKNNHSSYQSPTTSLVTSNKISVKIMGAVVNPGTYTLTTEDSLRDLITKAGGAVTSADSSCYDENGDFVEFDVNHPTSQVTFAKGFENCTITCIQESLLASSLGDYDFAVLPGNTALKGLGDDYAARIVFGEKVSDETLSLRANGVAVRKEDAQSEKSKAIAEAFGDDRVKEYIGRTFGESVIYHYEKLIG